MVGSSKECVVPLICSPQQLDCGFHYLLSAAEQAPMPPVQKGVQAPHMVAVLVGGALRQTDAFQFVHVNQRWVQQYVLHFCSLSTVVAKRQPHPQ